MDSQDNLFLPFIYVLIFTKLLSPKYVTLIYTIKQLNYRLNIKMKLLVNIHSF